MTGKALLLTALALNGDEGERIEAAPLEGLARRGYDVEAVDCRDVDIVPCTGCGSCGLRTPGACAVKDGMQAVFRSLVASDLLVLATPVRFGSYCAELKKVVDRFQPLMVPLYVVRRGEMHFRGRYDFPALLGVGMSADPAETEAFRHLVGRLAVNVDARHAVATFTGGAEAADEEAATEAVEGALAALEPAPGRSAGGPS
jgi:multimeric flavodoxin WrbA